MYSTLLGFVLVSTHFTDENFTLIIIFQCVSTAVVLFIDFIRLTRLVGVTFIINHALLGLKVQSNKVLKLKLVAAMVMAVDLEVMES